MGQYTKNGLYAGYKKNHSEREALDFYSTPTAEVENILTVLDYDFTGQTILEPCVGGGHMANGIVNYLNSHDQEPKLLIATDIKDRGFVDVDWKRQYNLDFLADDYPYSEADVIIMNPPYATLEPFLIRALEIAKHKLIVLCRTQVLEGGGRYENIFAKNPPTDVYQYVNRIQCYKNGVEVGGSDSQAYCWLVWDKDEHVEYPRLHWIKRATHN